MDLVGEREQNHTGEEQAPAAGQPAEAGLTQRQRLLAAVTGMPRRSAVSDIENHHRPHEVSQQPPIGVSQVARLWAQDVAACGPLGGD